MYDVILQPITPESNIPFKKVLLISDGITITTATLKGMDENGYIFNMTVTSVGVDGDIQHITRTPFRPTHYAILNITINK